MSGYLAHALTILANPHVLFVITLSSFYGLFIGAIPGLTATMATALLVPLTFFMDPLPALAAIVTMEAMAIFSGDIPATLVRIPGTPSSAAYTQDSYELTKRGHAELALGVDVVFSVIGVLFMQGLRPGPMIFENRPEIVYAVYITFIIANLLMIPFGYLAIKFSSTMIRVPRNILMPLILICSLVGAFAINNSLFDVGVMLVMGIIGYFMEKHDIPVAPAVLGIVLGPIVEENFMVSMIKSEWDFTQFFSRPISAVLCVLALLVWFFPVIIDYRSTQRNKEK